jgi:predicted metalloprotease with PDZ domain
MKNQTVFFALFVMFSASGANYAIGGGQAAEIPDFTQGAKIPEDAKHDWNLGATGLRGWMYCDKMVTSDARQIAITKVAKGSPAYGILEVGDVILGVSGKPFSYDPRTEIDRKSVV